MNRFWWFFLFTICSLFILGRSSAQAQTPDADKKKAEARLTQIVKYDTLASEVLKHRGKVVVVELWSVY